MDIESKEYKLTRAAYGGFTVLRKLGGQTAHAVNVPTAHELALMSEKQFDLGCESILDAGAWPTVTRWA